MNDSVGSSNLKEFKRRFPDRLVNVGIAEQNLVGVSAGLRAPARSRSRAARRAFLTGRALEQIKADLAYSRHNVKLCGMSSGMAYGELGPDAPLDRGPGVDAGHRQPDGDRAGRSHRDRRRPCAPLPRIGRSRVPRDRAACPVPTVHADDARRSRSGGPSTLRAGTDVTIIAAGVTVGARAGGGRGCSTPTASARRVINMSTVRPIDRDAIVEAARRGPIVTVEEHTVYGGLGSAVAEVVVSTHPVRMRLLGVPGVFAPTGSPTFLLEHFGLTRRRHPRRRAALVLKAH